MSNLNFHTADCCSDPEYPSTWVEFRLDRFSTWINDHFLTIWFIGIISLIICSIMCLIPPFSSWNSKNKINTNFKNAIATMSLNDLQNVTDNQLQLLANKLNKNRVKSQSDYVVTANDLRSWINDAIRVCYLKDNEIENLIHNELTSLQQ